MMLPIVTVALFIIFMANGINGQPNDRIVVVKMPQKAERLIKRPCKYFCQELGATIISSEWVMTAGHCIDPKDPVNIVKIRVGTNDRTRGGRVLDIKRIVVQYKGLLNDIALIQTSKSMEFTDRIRPISIPNKDTQGGANVMYTGWRSVEGDSGGPLVEGNAVVGIASFILNGCGHGLPDGATRVFFYREWIL